MDANQRSEFNNQTNNLANEKWTPGSTGKTADDGPLDHSYPRGTGVQQQGNQGIDTMGTQQTGAGPGAQPGGTYGRDDSGNQNQTPGGAMQTQINGGSGPVQGITDSHQRQMEQKSSAYGMLEQPVGHRPADTGVNLNAGHDMHLDVVRGQLPSQSADQPDLQGGSLGPKHGNMQGSTQHGGMHGPQAAPTSLTAGSVGNRQQTSSLYANEGSTGNPVRDGGTIERQPAGATPQPMTNPNADGGVHESNDAAGGLPRSPGNSGATNAGGSADRSGSQTGTGAADSGPPPHDSNDAAGGYPRSPGYANKLNGDSNMDDDTGFKRKG